MTTPAAAVESATSTPIDPGTGAEPGHEAPNFGTVGELREALGLSDDDGEGTEGAETTGGEPAARGAAAVDEAGAEDPDVAAIKRINARSARHRARARAERQATSAPRPAAPVAAAPLPAAAKPPETAAALTGPQALAAEQAKQVLNLIAQLAGDDATAAADSGSAAAAKPDAQRDALVRQIQDKLDAIQAGAKEGETVLKGEIAALKTQLTGIESAKTVRDHIEKNLDPIAAEVPLLAGRRNAIEILHVAVGKFWDRAKKKTGTGQLPDIKDLARRIEKKLAATATEKQTEKRPETTAKPRKTVSNNLASPPAARLGPDDRTNEEAQRDFKKRFGLDD